jgi:ABC-type transport system involved in cytochrome c biogenesis permease subunit
VSKAGQEFFFSTFEPFYKAMVIYVLALVLALCSWVKMSDWLRRSAFYLVGLAWVIHTFGLVFRMYLEGRPPVTNLYSSAIFIGWGAVILGMILEKIYHDGIGCVVAAFAGFVTQIIAHNLALSGDTMEMMRAVLDTNFWLATHVVTVTLGYASTFVAGFLAIIYILRGMFTTTLSEQTAKSLARMVYGIVCFATLFSFIGTVLGGIWADQSWGRFWGWDPKENGALLIVLWNAAILHARWGGFMSQRGLMLMAIMGNIVTSWSWFGVNMLGIGLHSYGFTDAAFHWLLLFVGSQVAIIAMALAPRKLWRSFQNKPTAPSP